MKNYVQKGDTLTLPAPAAVVAGDVVVVGSLVGIAASAAESGAPVEVATRGVFSLPKLSTDDIAVGDLVYLHATGVVTKTSGTTLVGTAVTAHGATLGVINVKLPTGPQGAQGPAGEPG